MKPLNKRRCLSACVWLGSICAASACMTAVLMLMPGMPNPRPRTPFAPRIRFLTGEFWAESGAGELIAVRSPALIALPNGVVRSASEQSRVNWTAPAVSAATSPALFLKRKPEPAKDLAAPGAGRQLTLPSLSPPRTDSGRALSPAMTADEQPAGARMTCHGALADAEIEWRGGALDKWTAPGSFWNAVFNVRFDSAGRPASVLLLSPAADSAINSAALRVLYQSRLKNPDGPREGRISLWFHCAGSAPAPDGPHNGKGNNAGS